MNSTSTHTENTRRDGRALARRMFLTTVTLALSLAVPTASAQAAGELFFDPVLSLTGGTATSTLDEVPDPGPSHPPATFNNPCGTATDRQGNIYVASSPTSGSQGRIDVFSASGHFLTQVKIENEPCALAVDSEGNIYTNLKNGLSEDSLVLFEPSSFPPTASTTYAFAKEIAQDNENGVAVDPSNDHVYVSMGGQVSEYDSAKNGSALLDDTIGTGPLDGRGPLADAVGVDVCGANHDVYVTSSPQEPYEPLSPRVYILSGAAGHPVKAVINGTSTPKGSFGFAFGNAAVAVHILINLLRHAGPFTS